MFNTPATRPALGLPSRCLGAVILAGGLLLATPLAAAARQPAAMPPTGPLLKVHAQQYDVRAWPTRQQRHRRHHHSGRHRHDRFGHHHSGDRSRGPRQRACHPVRHVDFIHGHKVLVGRLLCYDRRGRAYVLRGSRHILRYLRH